MNFIDCIRSSSIEDFRVWLRERGFLLRNKPNKPKQLLRWNANGGGSGVGEVCIKFVDNKQKNQVNENGLMDLNLFF